LPAVRGPHVARVVYLLLFLFSALASPPEGKTTTVVEAVYQLATFQKLKILLVAPSNDAADVLVERLSQYFPPSELRRILAYSRTIDTVSAHVRDYVREYTSPEAQLAEILRARIVVSTVNHAARISYFGVPSNHFDVLCVDEAGHATEPEIVSLAASIMDFSGGKRSGQVVLAGDPKQLGPIITSPICRALGMSVSYLERLMGREVYERRDGDEKYRPELVTKLVRNYRSHPSIIELPNRYAGSTFEWFFFVQPRGCWLNRLMLLCLLSLLSQTLQHVLRQRAPVLWRQACYS